MAESIVGKGVLLGVRVQHVTFGNRFCVQNVLCLSQMMSIIFLTLIFFLSFFCYCIQQNGDKVETKILDAADVVGLYFSA